MTAEQPAAIDQAAAIDAALVAWGKVPLTTRGAFGRFAVRHLRDHGLAVQAGPPEATGLSAVLEQFRPLIDDNPLIAQALTMGVEDVADLLAALAERDLRWLPGERGQCGTLLEAQAEPPDLHVVFDAVHGAWQRDDDRARELGGDICARWFGPVGMRCTFAALQRSQGPMTPDGGIAPTTPRDELAPAPTR